MRATVIQYAPMLLRIDDLRTHFQTDEGVVRAVDGVTLEIPRGKTVALVGESGCGKSVTALSILRLVPHPGRIVSGSILFDGRDLCRLEEKALRGLRGGRIAMIFQEPMTSLNPVMSVGRQIVEAIELHRDRRGRTAARANRARAVELLTHVGIPSPEARFDEYPHRMSGGMRQRVMIAMALAGDPSLLIADEPTTALDVTIQAQIVDLLRDLQQRQNLSILLVTHDWGVVAELADFVYVMYAGRIVERAAVARIFADPRHPYTQGLLRCMPRLETPAESGRKRKRLETIAGEVPRRLDRPTGCAFHPRCEQGRDDAVCRSQRPNLCEVADAHLCACWKADGYPALKDDEATSSA